MKLRHVKAQRPKKFNGICFVGEAPGAQEDLTGKPFVGPSGKLLNKMLDAAKIKRDNCYITNVFSIRPPHNNVQYYFKRDNGILLNKELSRLSQEIHDLRPNVIFALGKTALWALTTRSEITNLSGKVIICGYGIVIPLFHPSYLIRGKKDDLILATEKSLTFGRKLCKRMERK